MRSLKQTGIVVFLDALGTKGIWQRHKPSKIIRWREFFINFSKEHIETIEYHHNSESKIGSKPVTRFFAFSDAIIETISFSRPELVIWDLANHLTELFVNAFHKNIYYRGAVSIGTFYQSENMVIGPAIDEAVSYHDNLEWAGVATSPSLRKLIRIMEKKGIDHGFCPCDIPTKKGIEYDGRSLMWPPFDILTSKGDRSIKSIIQKEIKQLDELGAIKKLQNTLQFYNFINQKYMTKDFKVEYLTTDKGWVS